MFPPTFEEFIDTSIARVKYRVLMVSLTDAFGRNNMDVLNKIASFIYPYCAPEPYKNLVIEISDGPRFDKGKSTNNVPVYKFGHKQLPKVFEQLSELPDLKKITWNFVCSAELPEIPKSSDFFNFWNLLENDNKTHIVMCSDFALHALPIDLQQLVLSDEKRGGNIDMFLCSDAKRLGQMHGSFELLFSAKEMNKTNDDLKMTIKLMNNTRCFKKVIVNDNISVIGKDTNDVPIYIQIVYNGILFNLLSAHFCELEKISGNNEFQKNILKSVGVDQNTIDNIPIPALKRIASCALQRQTSCDTGPNLTLARHLTQQLTCVVSETKDMIMSEFLPKADCIKKIEQMDDCEMDISPLIQGHVHNTDTEN